MPMLQSERDEWVTALRSGEYPQGQGSLEKEGKYCCLGVKCHLDFKAQRNGVVRKPSIGSIGFFTYGTGDNPYGFNGQFPVREILNAWGLPSEQSDQLASMNDDSNRYWTFKRIANWIEKNVEVIPDPPKKRVRKVKV